MNFSKLSLVAFTVIFCSLCFVHNVQSQAQPFGASGVDIFAEHTVFSPCSGEEVFFPDGVCHFSVHGVVKPNGDVKTNFHFNFNLVGTGQSSGNTYHCISPYNEMVHETEVGVEGTVFIVQNLISQGGGSGSNLYYTFKATYTVDAEGNFELDIEEDGFVCNGN